MTSPAHLHRRRWRIVTASTVGAGVAWTLQPPGGFAWRIVSVAARLVTSAVAGNRRVFFIAGSAERNYFDQPANTDQAASQTVDYCGHTGASPGGVVPGALTVPLPSSGLLLLAGRRLTVTVTGLDAGDQWSLVHALVDETTGSDQPIGDQTDETPRDYPGV